MPFQRPRITRPPYEAFSYFLPLTFGCSNSRCTFCNYFYGHKLQLREKDDVIREIDALKHFTLSGEKASDMPDIMYYVAEDWNGKSIFLQDGDALVYPYAHLREILEHLNNEFPGLERVTCYGTAGDILALDVEKLTKLKALKLNTIYLGVESGDDDILLSVDKADDAQSMVAAGRLVKESGINCAVTVIMGLGGREKSNEHALSTARILSEINPDAADVLTLTLVPGTPMYDSQQRGEFTPITPMQSIQELKTIVENVNFSHCLFRSIHASNYLTLNGYLPQDKSLLLESINLVLSRQDPTLLKPEHMRGL